MSDGAIISIDTFLEVMPRTDFDDTNIRIIFVLFHFTFKHPRGPINSVNVIWKEAILKVSSWNLRSQRCYIQQI